VDSTLHPVPRQAPPGRDERGGSFGFFHLGAEAAGLGVVKEKPLGALFVGGGAVGGLGFVRGPVIGEERLELGDLNAAGGRRVVARDQFYRFDEFVEPAIDPSAKALGYFRFSSLGRGKAKGESRK
jgi:hypothetical protein